MYIDDIEDIKQLGFGDFELLYDKDSNVLTVLTLKGCCMGKVVIKNGRHWLDLSPNLLGFS